ncbi:hypothetical protein HNP46_000365 [Pseudomonas nitritireducens]|uniref:Uncharacterized protein n=1 Tax=Pseudomonas nitroreducens TaxID=46680 RepID=A0A7W7KEX6_PSENT|nr:hypothetical protein [Pseudomonas nitritireducens]MBB4861554.1 hypothetical protein [Pseudomonas nitritireducens]
MALQVVYKKSEAFGQTCRLVTNGGSVHEFRLSILRNPDEVTIQVAGAESAREVRFSASELGKHHIINFGVQDGRSLASRCLSNLPIHEIDPTPTLDAYHRALDGLFEAGEIDVDQYTSALELLLAQYDDAGVLELQEFLRYQHIWIAPETCVVMRPTEEEVAYWAMVWPAVLGRLRQLYA